MKLNFFSIFLLFFPIFYGEASQDLRIHLTSEATLDPIYISHFINGERYYEPSYIEQLETVLSFDFQNNGLMQTIKNHPDKEKILKSQKLLPSTSLDEIKTWKIPYILKIEVIDKTLHSSLFIASENTVKNFNISLSGKLSADRCHLHRLADLVYQSIYQEPGIASSKIFYAVKNKQNEKWISEIWCCDWDGGNPEQITNEGSYCINPIYFKPQKGSPQLLYVSYKQGQPKIYQTSLKDKNSRRLISLRGNQLLPALSHTQDKMAFICDVAGQADLFIQSLSHKEGEKQKPIQLFSYPYSTQGSPTFNPDATQIAFVSDKDGSPRIYTLPISPRLKKTVPHLLTKRNHENSCPAWSPDGKKLAYSAKTKGIRQLWIYDFETGEEYPLTEGPEHKENPSWAPNSRHLVFNLTSGSNSEICIINMQQRQMIKISKGSGIKHYPMWANP